jgi:hypothetical protein
MRLVALGVLLSFALPGIASACQFNTDCDVGSKCVKSSGSIYGWCVGGLNPGNSNDRQPAKDPLDVTGKKGNTCQFDVDCGPGGNCVKGNGINGTCM